MADRNLSCTSHMLAARQYRVSGAPVNGQMDGRWLLATDNNAGFAVGGGPQVSAVSPWLSEY
jgi:hypothetical protein